MSAQAACKVGLPHVPDVQLFLAGVVLLYPGKDEVQYFRLVMRALFGGFCDTRIGVTDIEVCRIPEGFCPPADVAEVEALFGALFYDACACPRTDLLSPAAAGIIPKKKTFPLLYEYEGKPLFYESFRLKQKAFMRFYSKALISRGRLCRPGFYAPIR